MESVLRALAVYAAILVMTRISGRRTLSDVTLFDFVVVLLVAETAQQVMINDDGSFTNALLLMGTLILTDVALSLAKARSRLVEHLIDGTPTVLIRDGTVDQQAMKRSRVTQDDVLQSARMQHGLSRIDEIGHAVLETSGTISILPRDDPPAPGSGQGSGPESGPASGADKAT